MKNDKLDSWVLKQKLIGGADYWVIKGDAAVGIDNKKLNNALSKPSGSFSLQLPPARVINLCYENNFFKSINSKIGDVEKLIIPDGVEVINLGSGYTRLNVRNLVVPDTVKALRGNTINVQNVHYDGVLEHIVDGDFGTMLMDNMESFKPVENISKYWECSDTALYKTSFMKTLKLDDSTKIIGEHCFENLNLYEIDTNKVEQIRSYAFYNCNSDTIVIRSGAKYIDYCAFQNNNSYEIYIEPGLKAILHRAFESCGNFEEVVLPETLEYLDITAFNWCNRLRKIKMPKSTKIVTCGLNRFYYGCDTRDYLKYSAVICGANEYKQKRPNPDIEIELY